MRQFFLLGICVLSLLAGRAAADDAGVTSTVATSRSSVSAGEDFAVAITLEVPQGKHIYWINPGDAGLATKFTFTPSAGVTVGPVEYPVPMKFLSPGDITDYGYVGKVTFLAHVTVAKTAKEVAIGVKGRWLCCDNRGCTPGEGTMNISIPMAAQGAVTNAELFEAARQAMPGPEWMKKDLQTGKLGGVSPVNMQNSFALKLLWKSKVKDVDLYPTEAEGVETEKIAVQSAGGQTVISFDIRTLAGQTPKVEKLPMLVVYTDESGTHRGFYVDADLLPVKGSGK